MTGIRATAEAAERTESFTSVSSAVRRCEAQPENPSAKSLKSWKSLLVGKRYFSQVCLHARHA
jgi:hypothetical protein